MTKLVSKQHTNDGAYHIKRLVNEANERLKQIGRQGKRATIVAKKSSLSLQFTLTDEQGKKQRNPGLGAIPVNEKGVQEAERIAQMVTNQLTANDFSWGWYNKIIGKDTSEQIKQLTCKEMVEKYKKYYFEQRKENKTVKGSWEKECRALEEVLGVLEKPLSLSLIRQILESKVNNSVARKEVLNGLTGFLKYSNNTDYKEIIKEYKANNKPKRRKRNVPDDDKVVEIFNLGFAPKPQVNKNIFYRYPQWQFLYSLLAIYGLRIHEAWNIANWDEPVTLKNGDWVTVGIDDDKEILIQRDNGDIVVPAILNPSNKEFLLCIKHSTKTGYRMAFPLSPEGHNWIEEFNLLQPLNLPDIKNPLGKSNKAQTAYRCSNSTCRWFKRNNYGFTPHDLRHAYNHRGHRLGFSPKALADSLGHSVTMNTTGYLRHMSDSVKLQGMLSAMAKEQNKRSENEILKEEIEALKAQLEAANNKIELLETRLQLNQTLKES